ncbi:Uncharacterized protein FWK35_00027463 [Aphis craccivora]|uniref:Uncharacterized protein n=1 Tax=Aphis craccivora TaxID=307492 RepID=A0A6G0W2Y4_APHCR|nr:Uncharacterized protein FWK35_00027463 [Aphis craccivora]
MLRRGVKIATTTIISLFNSDKCVLLIFYVTHEGGDTGECSGILINCNTVKKIYLKITTIFLKSHNFLQPTTHGVNTRYAKNNFFITKTKKTTTNRYFEIIGTKLVREGTALALLLL